MSTNQHIANDPNFYVLVNSLGDLSDANLKRFAKAVGIDAAYTKQDRKYVYRHILESLPYDEVSAIGKRLEGDYLGGGPQSKSAKARANYAEDVWQSVWNKAKPVKKEPTKVAPKPASKSVPVRKIESAPKKSPVLKKSPHEVALRFLLNEEPNLDALKESLGELSNSKLIQFAKVLKLDLTLKDLTSLKGKAYEQERDEIAMMILSQLITRHRFEPHHIALIGKHLDEGSIGGRRGGSARARAEAAAEFWEKLI